MMFGIEVTIVIASKTFNQIYISCTDAQLNFALSTNRVHSHSSFANIIRIH